MVLLLKHPPFACWSAGSIVYLKMDLGKSGFGGKFAFKLIGWFKVSKCQEGVLFCLGVAVEWSCLVCGIWVILDGLKLQIAHKTEFFSIMEGLFPSCVDTYPYLEWILIRAQIVVFEVLALRSKSR